MCAQNITLTLEAEKDIPSEILKDISPRTSFSTYATLEKETNRILERFQQTGFIDSRLVSISETTSEIETNEEIIYKAIYYLGPKFSNITIFYNEEHFSKKRLAQFIANINENSFTIPITEVEKTLLKLNSLQTEKGDAFAKIYLTQLKKNGSELNAYIISEATTTRKIDSINIKGYEKFPVSYLKYLAGLKKGVVFNKSKIEKANTAIEALPFASSIKDPEVLFKDNQTSLYLYLEKEKSNNFDGIIGFNTDEETNRIIFNGYLDLQLNNNLNFGETLTLNYKSDGNNQQSIFIKTTLPYILKSPVGIDLGLNIFRQDENFSNTAQNAGLRYQINPNATATINYSSTNSSILTDELENSIEFADFTKNEISIGSIWKFFQSDNLFPIKASINIEAGIGERTTDRADENQFRLNLDTSYIFRLNYKNSILLKNLSGILNSESYITNELYRIGGINSIRGFNENTIEANLYSLFNTEYRYRFNNTIYVHSIIDLGYFENEISNQRSNLYSFGFGTGFFTKTGLLRLSIANGKIDNKAIDISNLKIHLSLITSF